MNECTEVVLVSLISCQEAGEMRVRPMICEAFIFAISVRNLGRLSYEAVPCELMLILRPYSPYSVPMLLLLLLMFGTCLDRRERPSVTRAERNGEGLGREKPNKEPTDSQRLAC